MDKLIINVPGTPASEIVLKPGLNRFGRSLNTDFQISHPSVSSQHCEIVVKEGTLTLRDLGSTNGTLLDGQPVTETSLQHGQILRIGDVEMIYSPVKTPLPSAPPVVAPPMRVPVPPRATQADPPIPPRVPMGSSMPVSEQIRLAPKSPARAPQNYFATLPGAFIYPFHRGGAILLATGAVFFVVLNFASGFAGLASSVIGVFCVGYLFSFLKSIIASTAVGDDEMPAWPDYDTFLTTALFPSLELLAVFVVCLGPALAYLRFAEHPHAWLAGVLFIAGFLYLPMGLLALAIYDNVLALNPILIIPSILRVPLEYAAICVILILLALSSAEAYNMLHTSLSVPVIAPIVSEWLFLYTLTVITRMAGLLYLSKKNRLQWKLTGR